ncbi:MAG: Ig-like domain-containing protein, partial [Xanthomonadales bacterium]|nr:Ig-like domain-containing protein [Xanthomonadales bacterium]
MNMSSLARHGLVWLSLVLPVFAYAATPVFVNELLYDNSGSNDPGEALEIAGPVGTDLTGWSIVLYNGSSSQRSPYGTPAVLSGTIPANCTGADGVMVVLPGQIQNGAPDGLALVDAGGNVVQFLSYEGSFVAASGPAMGMTSTDIGVTQNNGTPEGQSLQLTGSGANYEDFTWTGPLTSSMGSCNAGQSFGPPVDVPPTVALTTPADGATNVAVSGFNFNVTFSESVTLTPGAITLQCNSLNQPGVMGSSGNTATFAPNADLPNAASCIATVHAANVTDTDGTADAMTADVSASFMTVGDFAPSVQSFTPASAATDVAVDTTVGVQFSEAVTLATGAVTLQCGTSDQPGALSGSGTDYIFTPTASLPYSAACTTTVHAALVTDQDGTADPMAADASSSFNTVADLPPSVSSTSPVDNSTTFPADVNLGVTFSEPVTLATGWYAIACTTSGTHTAVQSGSGASYSLNPDTDFTVAEACTLTIHAADVHDATAHAMAADVIVHFSVVGGVADYYQGADTSSGPALHTWLHTRLTTAPTPYTSIVAYPYTDSDTDTWDILSLADSDPSNPVAIGTQGGEVNSGNILDLYKNTSLPYLGGGQQQYNREHTWPQSLGFPEDSINSKPNPPHNDTHMLYLSDHDYNGQRGNGLLGDCPASANCTPLWTVANNGYGGDHNNPGDANLKDGNTLFEVWDHRKGDVARAVMYMAVRYDGGIDADGICEPELKLTDDPGLVSVMDAQNAPNCSGPSNVAYNGLLSDLLLWNYQDPPDAQEKLRNSLVFSYQHNRNPFIDHPEWAMCVFKNIDCDRIFKNGFDGFEAASG